MSCDRIDIFHRFQSIHRRGQKRSEEFAHEKYSLLINFESLPPKFLVRLNDRKRSCHESSVIHQDVQSPRGRRHLYLSRASATDLIGTAPLEMTSQLPLLTSQSRISHFQSHLDLLNDAPALAKDMAIALPYRFLDCRL